MSASMLQHHASKPHKEQRRYQDPAVLKELHGKLGGLHAQYVTVNGCANEHQWHTTQEGCTKHRTLELSTNFSGWILASDGLTGDECSRSTA